MIGLRILTQAAAIPILSWLEECFELCGRPLELMSNNGQPFVTWMPYVLPLRQTPAGPAHSASAHPDQLALDQWQDRGLLGGVQAEVLDRQRFASLADAEAATARFVQYNYHRLSGVLGWVTPAERYDGTPFADRGFDHIPP